MENLANKKVAAIVPAFNEEANVGDVLKVLLNSKDVSEVILVDDGSKDKTSEIGKRLGVKVITLEKNGGKGNAMIQGVRSTDAQIIVFFDADLKGLAKEHVEQLVEPMLKENVDMCVGLRGRFLGLPEVIAKIDPLMAIGGERAIKRYLIEAVPEETIQGFAVETVLNYYCFKKNKKVKYVVLKGLDIITKERKWGLVRGLKNRLKMIREMARARRELKNLNI
jgi:GT2 family glycosyltransferase